MITPQFSKEQGSSWEQSVPPHGVMNGRRKMEKMRNALHTSTLVFSIPEGRKECFLKVRGLKTEKHSGVSMEYTKQN